MKTRTRHKADKSEKYNTSIIVWFFITAFLYWIFWDAIADVSMILYLIWLFAITPLYFLLLVSIQKIYEQSSCKSIKYWVYLLFISVLLILYIFTQYSIFLYAMIGLSAIVGIINYIPYLEIKHSKKLSLLQSRSKNRRIFKSYLKSKNFLNHHNYYSSPENEAFYKKSIWKQGVMSYVVGSGFISFIIIMSGLEDILKWSMSLWSVFWMYIMLFLGIMFIWVIIFLYKYITRILFWNKNKKQLKFYQVKMNTKSFIHYKNKIFFY